MARFAGKTRFWDAVNKRWRVLFRVYGQPAGTGHRLDLGDPSVPYRDPLELAHILFVEAALQTGKVTLSQYLAATRRIERARQERGDQ